MHLCIHHHVCIYIVFKILDVFVLVLVTLETWRWLLIPVVLVASAASFSTSALVADAGVGAEVVVLPNWNNFQSMKTKPFTPKRAEWKRRVVTTAANAKRRIIHWSHCYSHNSLVTHGRDIFVDMPCFSARSDRVVHWGPGRCTAVAVLWILTASDHPRRIIDGIVCDSEAEIKSEVMGGMRRWGLNSASSGDIRIEVKRHHFLLQVVKAEEERVP